jgi:hypothetical protein
MNEMVKALGDTLETQLDALVATNRERDTLTDEFQLKLNLIHMQYLISDIELLRAAIKNLNAILGVMAN